MSIYETSVHEPRMTPGEFVAEFRHTWPRHLGYVSRAARIFQVTPMAMARRLYRYKQLGFDIEFVDDTKKWRRNQ